MSCIKELFCMRKYDKIVFNLNVIVIRYHDDAMAFSSHVAKTLTLTWGIFLTRMLNSLCSLPSGIRMSCLSRKSKVGHWPTRPIVFKVAGAALAGVVDVTKAPDWITALLFAALVVVDE